MLLQTVLHFLEVTEAASNCQSHSFELPRHHRAVRQSQK